VHDRGQGIGQIPLTNGAGQRLSLDQALDIGGIVAFAHGCGVECAARAVQPELADDLRQSHDCVFFPLRSVAECVKGMIRLGIEVP
jgi:hypothetical protein